MELCISLVVQKLFHRLSRRKMTTDRVKQVADMGLVHIEQGLGYIHSGGPEREAIYALDCVVLHAVVEKTDLDIVQRSFSNQVKFRKLNTPAKKTTSNMLWVMDRKAKVAAICLENEEFGLLQKKCKEAFQAGSGLAVKKFVFIFLFQVILPHLGHMQLKREQFPLELACATTVHDCIGNTESSVATSLDDKPENHMWARSMLFTLLTRVERLSQLCLCGFSPQNLRHLLRLRTFWHAAADDWCFKVNLLKTKPNPPLPPPRGPFYELPLQGLPPPMVNVVYILESKAHLVCYVGSTDNADRRLSQHNAKRGSVETAWTQDWVMKACIMGFQSGRPGREDAFRVESQLRHKPLLPRLSFTEWVRLAHFLVDEQNFSRASPLWILLL